MCVCVCVTGAYTYHVVLPLGMVFAKSTRLHASNVVLPLKKKFGSFPTKSSNGIGLTCCGRSNVKRLNPMSFDEKQVICKHAFRWCNNHKITCLSNFVCYKTTFPPCYEVLKISKSLNCKSKWVFNAFLNLIIIDMTQKPLVREKHDDRIKGGARPYHCVLQNIDPIFLFYHL